MSRAGGGGRAQPRLCLSVLEESVCVTQGSRPSGAGPVTPAEVPP